MNSAIISAKCFAREHLERMLELKDMVKKFSAQKDQYMVGNINFEVDSMILYES